MKKIKLKNIIVLAGVIAAAGAHADDKFSINGFGYQDYRQTNANFSEGASQRGTWDNNFFAVAMSAKVSDRDTAWAQLQANSTEPTRFTWMFVDHRFTDNVSMHVGRVKFPYGLYNEYIDNKWLQLSAVTPTAYSGAADMIYDAYSGVGLDWTSGSLFTQVYGGNIYVTDPASDEHADRRLIGTRITWNTPYEGLRLMVSANEAQIEFNANAPGGVSNVLTQLGKEDRAMLSLDYVSDKLDIKSEYNYHKVPFLPADPAATPTTRSNAWYVQVGYKMGLWTPYVRYDSFHADQQDKSSPAKYQKDSVVGINYRVNDNVNARIEDHVIQGYGIAEAGNTKNWNLMAAEVNFLF
jgi:hypothetical protein